MLILVISYVNWQIFARFVIIYLVKPQQFLYYFCKFRTKIDAFLRFFKVIFSLN